jgi:hypothetical protein
MLEPTGAAAMVLESAAEAEMTIGVAVTSALAVLRIRVVKTKGGCKLQFRGRCGASKNVRSGPKLGG